MCPLSFSQLSGLLVLDHVTVLLEVESALVDLTEVFSLYVWILARAILASAFLLPPDCGTTIGCVMVRP